jgi:hypothetical protein
VLAGDDGELPPLAAALARFAVTVTAEPWALTRDVLDDVAAQGIGPDAMEAAVGVVALFNYFTRVADASGIEFDYTSPLPTFEPDVCRVPAARPDRSAWPVVGGERRTFVRRPALRDAWQRWRDYVFGSDQPLSRRERTMLAAAAAAECCDAWRVDELAGAGIEPRTDAEQHLVDFACRMSRHPWQMTAEDLDGLRAAGYPELALLHAISVVALQNADSRLALVLRLLRD